MPSNFNYENFQQVANGFFQAEGAVGACRIRNLKFIPVFVLTQNYSIESLNFFFFFFLTLWHILGRNTNLSIIVSSSGKLVIRMTSESWKVILSSLMNYFSLLYGEKLIAFKKLVDIRQLTQSGIMSNIELAVRLVYTLALDGVSRNLTLLEQLSLFNFDKSISPINLPVYTDNTPPPKERGCSFYFIYNRYGSRRRYFFIRLRLSAPPP